MRLSNVAKLMHSSENPSRPTLRNINLEVRPGQKIAICGEVGSGKSTLLAAILGKIPSIQGTVQIYGRIAYVSQSAWIQMGTIQQNILFGSPLDSQRYKQTLVKCSLLKDLELLPYSDLTEIGERGVNLSGGQKQHIQLARALCQNADIYLLDDPFNAVDVHTASSLLNVRKLLIVLCFISLLDWKLKSGLVFCRNTSWKLSQGKLFFLVTHQVDFLPPFDMVLLLSDGEILHAAPYHQLLASTKEFQDLVDAHKETAGSGKIAEVTLLRRESHTRELRKNDTGKNSIASEGDPLIKEEEREVGDTGFKPYVQYLNQNKGYLFFAMAVLSHITFAVGQVTQNFWMAAHVDNPHVSTLILIGVITVESCSVSGLMNTSNEVYNLKNYMVDLKIRLVNLENGKPWTMLIVA
ncbi:ABC transporter C family member 10 [Capsicum baccatum]|uniref:ABC-type xenobiotic transporter n=1 Tax=Capsicum baccatum TaxID=33114 RepID=A0A2G2VFR4_CAPBA|nr:ABC transporter C family member 10 [Capsicum baccatum]